MALLRYFGTALPSSVLVSLVAAITIAITASNRLNCSDFVRELPQTVQAAVFPDEPQNFSKNKVFVTCFEEEIPESSLC